MLLQRLARLDPRSHRRESSNHANLPALPHARSLLARVQNSTHMEFHVQLTSKKGNFRCENQEGKLVKPTASTGFLERAMGIELHPKFLSLTETRCYQPLCESIVAKCCQKAKDAGSSLALRLIAPGVLVPVNPGGTIHIDCEAWAFSSRAKSDRNCTNYSSYCFRSAARMKTPPTRATTHSPPR
jgi:hypothetical protein